MKGKKLDETLYPLVGQRLLLRNYRVIIRAGNNHYLPPVLIIHSPDVARRNLSPSRRALHLGTLDRSRIRSGAPIDNLSLVFARKLNGERV